jgi:hypothetical protein
MLQALFQSAQHLYLTKKEGSGSEFIHLTKGCGSGKPKNIRIRIPNTGQQCFKTVL